MYMQWCGSILQYVKSIAMYMMCAVQDETELVSSVSSCTAHSIRVYIAMDLTYCSMLPHHCMYITKYFYRTL
jgi:hypothetical protein